MYIYGKNATPRCEITLTREAFYSLSILLSPYLFGVFSGISWGYNSQQSLNMLVVETI
jgi:hypothetical protein